ncbi:hypothetical protein E1301_Tti016406 [Triplophysa tibetana]|uniref:Uncharacterized protein n=1 Tax=Triplophysa tibetana TaxID=1572043 RepID=A0A5A9MYC4_9TELE|nr:hypothetical protein E1301_Tti016406 [Triplophysa tibetana]
MFHTMMESISTSKSSDVRGFPFSPSAKSINLTQSHGGARMASSARIAVVSDSRRMGRSSAGHKPGRDRLV